jgi:hypothetical protein
MSTSGRSIVPQTASLRCTDCDLLSAPRRPWDALLIGNLICADKELRPGRAQGEGVRPTIVGIRQIAT